MQLEQDWQGFKRSVATYTRIPINIQWESPTKHTPSVCFLPWVGALVAVISAWPLLLSGWSPEFQALLMMLSAVLLTGAFHEDGLMDACDGLVGGWTQEQRLTIMKDSRVGSYGVLAGIFCFAIKWWLLSQWITKSLWQDGLLFVLLGWITVHVAARWLPLGIMTCMNYVSLGQSKAKSMIAEVELRGAVWIALSMAFIVALIGISAWFSILSVLVMAGIACGLYLWRRINGYNGDSLGAVEQIGELLVLFTLLGWQA
ncbi:adenosylcobinamide-GDP ribazoletransferase [Marinomonas fungiae]|uniref:Adenosylcobinamide-GDP ribazoletransferase n=1 Tax=Marinomonas fungiae TaxID=1137284 RepID=A0A0K6IHA9_9GAMM|nr:adenosylcobinamide-GDP ribazoletransferase [Marinomonas fungiae]CUB02530.1 cobalamin-5'-phosphate synthase [Marinomonas fungiae]